MGTQVVTAMTETLAEAEAVETGETAGELDMAPEEQGVDMAATLLAGVDEDILPGQLVTVGAHEVTVTSSVV